MCPYFEVFKMYMFNCKGSERGHEWYGVLFKWRAIFQKVSFISGFHVRNHSILNSIQPAMHKVHWPNQIVSLKHFVDAELP